MYATYELRPVNCYLRTCTHEVIWKGISYIVYILWYNVITLQHAIIRHVHGVHAFMNNITPGTVTVL